MDLALVWALRLEEKTDNLVLDPMAGGGVVSDVCMLFERKCQAFDKAQQTACDRRKSELAPPFHGFCVLSNT